MIRHTLSLVTLAATLSAQLTENPILRPPEQPNPKTLLSPALIDTLVNEISGALSVANILEIAPYERNRTAEEYAGLYRESAYVQRKLKEFKLDDVDVKLYPMPQKQWDGEEGEFWVMKPTKKLIVNYRDVAASLAVGSKSADVTAELIYAGRGDNKNDYAGKNIKGNIVLVSGPPMAAFDLAINEFGAAGIASFNNPTGRPFDRPDQIAWNALGRGISIGEDKNPFAFNLSHRMGVELMERLEKGEKLTVRAKVKTTEYDTKMQVPTAVIKGDGTSDQEITIVAHLFEGVAKQGGMDNTSGSAMILEIARVWQKLINDGAVPRPRRTVRFLWVPEISGSAAYIRANPEETKKMIAAIAIDMAGGDVSKSHNSLRLMTTPYSVPTYLNDVHHQFFDFVGETNREKVNNRRLFYGFQYPILDPKGSRDEFYYNIEKHYGASDHVVYLGAGIPALLYNNWPDVAYHTSEDSAANADPTQAKRAAFVALASSMVIANSDGPGAIGVAGMVSGYAGQRAGKELGNSLQELADGGSLRAVLARVKATYEREADSIRSATVLADKDLIARKKIEDFANDFYDTGLKADTARIESFARAKSVSLSPLSADEARAAKLIPVRVKPNAPMQMGGGGGGRNVSPQDAERLTGMGLSEAKAFANGKRSVLDIRDAVSAEFGGIDVKLFLAVFDDLVKSGDFELLQK